MFNGLNVTCQRNCIANFQELLQYICECGKAHIVAVSTLVFHFCYFRGMAFAVTGSSTGLAITALTFSLFRPVIVLLQFWLEKKT